MQHSVPYMVRSGWKFCLNLEKFGGFFWLPSVCFCVSTFQTRCAKRAESEGERAKEKQSLALSLCSFCQRSRSNVTVFLASLPHGGEMANKLGGRVGIEKFLATCFKTRL